jgi:hypothetical protein
MELRGEMILVVKCQTLATKEEFLSENPIN